MNSSHTQSGFTLVELAIVMIIIGLLIGGILKGQELIENAKVTAQIARVKSYQATFTAFQDKFGQFPGDMANASSIGGQQGRIPNCNVTTMCFNGNGNGIIGRVVRNRGAGGALREFHSQAGVINEPEIETTMFWKHLVLSNFTIGIPGDANPINAAWGETHPASPMRGGFHVFYSADVGDWGTGTVLRWQSGANEDASAAGQGSNPVSPIQAFQIDRKMDDGRPDTGSVAADFDGTNCDSGGDYQNTTQKNCIMYFGLE